MVGATALKTGGSLCIPRPPFFQKSAQRDRPHIYAEIYVVFFLETPNMPKITYNDKTNTKAVTNRDTQATAEDFNDVKSSVNAIYDGVSTTTIPIKIGDEFVDSPLQWSGVPGENVISSETIEVPPGTIQIGEGLKLSAAGVVPLFNSALTGKRYVPSIMEYDETGSKKPSNLSIASNSQLVIQPDFSLNAPLSGMFTVSVTASEFVNNLILKCTPISIIGNMRMRMVAQSTGEPIYYFPSKAGWLDDQGEDIIVDASGEVNIDISEAPLGLLEGESIDIDYIADSGDLFGNGSVPYLEVTRQAVTFINTVPEAPTDGKQYGRQSEDWTEIIHEGHYLGVFVDLASLQSAHPTANNGDTATVTTPSANLFYWNGAAWVDTGTGYLGDMLKAVYDPTTIGSDAFSMVNMVEGADAKIMTLAERTKLTGVADGAEVNVQSDWDQTLTGADDYIKNKPAPGVTATQINNTTGYANYLDSSTSGSPRAYATDTAQPLINDKAFPDGARYPDGVTSYWDSTVNKFTPDQADGNYSFTIDFIADPAIRDKRVIINFVSYNAGGPGIDVVLHSRLVRLQKDDNELTHVSLSFTIGITSAIVANGVGVTLQFEETAADIYDITCGLAKCGAEII